MIRLAPGPAEIVDEVPAGRFYKDGKLIVDAQARTVADRRRLAYVGVISVALAVDEAGVLMGEPELNLIGIPETDADGADMAAIAHDAVIDTFNQLPRPRRRDPASVEEAVKRAVRATISAHWGKKPLCVVHVVTV
jgi:ribonuclease J